MTHTIYCGDPKNERELCTALYRALGADGCEDPNCVTSWHEGAWRALRRAANLQPYGRVTKADVVMALRMQNLLEGYPPTPTRDHP